MLYKRLIPGFLLVFVCYNAIGQFNINEISWQHLGPFQTPPSTADSNEWSSTGLGWVESLKVLNNGNDLYAGLITSGLYHKGKKSNEWNSVFNIQEQYGVLDMVVTKKEILVATGVTHYNEHYGIGVLCSKNNGRSWHETGLTFSHHDKKTVWCLEALPQNKTLIACTDDEIYRSIDGGKIWDTVYTLVQNSFRHLVASPHNDNIVIASGRNLLLSKDAGSSFTDKTKSLSVHSKETIYNYIQRIAVCIDPNVSGKFLALYQYKNTVYLDVSFDYGESWTNVMETRSISRIDINHAEVAVAPGNSDVILIGGVRAYLSTDGGKQFNQVTFPNYMHPQFAHDDIREIVMLNDSVFYLGTDGGVVMSKNSAQSWTDINGNGLCGLMIYGVALVGNTVMVGCQDVGTFTFLNGEWTSQSAIYGDGGDGLLRGNRIMSINGGRVKVLGLDFNTLISYTSPPTKMHPFSSKYYEYPNSTDSFFYISDYVWFSDGKRWYKQTEGIDNRGYRVNSFAISNVNTNLRYFAFDQPAWGNPRAKTKFYRSLDGGSTWLNLTDSLPILDWRYISSIAINDEKEQEICVAMGMIDEDVVHKVYRSNDLGNNWINWSEGMTNAECFKIVHILGSKSGYIVSTTAGMFYRNEYMDKWALLEGAMPRIAVRDFEIDYSSNTLYAGTYGNGLWKFVLTDDMLRD